MKKKSLLVLSAVTIAFMFSSCRKDYTCNCVVFGETQTVIYNQEHKKDATKACEERETAAKLDDSSASCTIVE